MDAQTLRAQAFRALHERDGVFVIPNPWDAGSARMLASLGFEALATTSAGYAFSQGRPDGGLTLDDTLANVRAIVAATDLPVAVDLENGFADDPAECAQSILAAAAAGAVGGSIEDFTGRPDAPIYCFEHAVARIEAAVAAARSLPFAFTLTARPRTICMAIRIWPTLFAACRHSPKRVPTCCMRQGCAALKRYWRWFAPWRRNRSMC